MNPGVCLTPCTEMNLKCINDLNINLSEGKIDVNLHDIRLGDGFLNMTPKVLSIKEVIDKLDFIKINIFCSVKDNVKRMIMQATN